MLTTPIEQRTALHDQLGCEDTNDYVIAVSRGDHAEALVTESWSFTRREAASLLAAAGPNQPTAEIPLDHHELCREGRYTQVYRTAEGASVALGRLLRHAEFAYRGEEFGLLAALGLRGAPVLFTAIAPGTRGKTQQAAIAAAGNGVLGFRRLPALDLRGIHARSQDPNIRHLGEGLEHPLLALPESGQRELPASG